jgi:predicted dehydrogenase
MSSFPAALPESTAIPLRGGATVRWGVLAPGGIAQDFVDSLHRNTDQRVVAVGSRSLERAGEFAARHGIPRHYDSYDALVGDPEVDVVYVASPHSEHRTLALLAIAAGKHVLVEKPIALSAAEARDIAAAAHAAGVFAMEAMWTRFLPQTTVIGRLLDDGVLGDLQLVSAGLEFGFGELDPAGRLLDPALGGGALLDLGVYPIWLSHFVLDAPTAVHAFGNLTPTGVDGQAVLALDHASGAQSAISTSLYTQGRNDAVIAGRSARIEIEPLFLEPRGFSLIGRDGQRLDFVDTYDYQWWRDGLAYQAVAVAQHIADGRTEAPEHPLDRTIAMLETIDDARTQLGYPPR